MGSQDRLGPGVEWKLEVFVRGAMCVSLSSPGMMVLDSALRMPFLAVLQTRRVDLGASIALTRAPKFRSTRSSKRSILLILAPSVSA